MPDEIPESDQSGGTTILVQNCIDRLRLGDEAARNELFQHAEERLRRLTHRMLGSFARVHNFEDTADVQQNASVRLLRVLKVLQINSAKDFFRLAATQIRRELIDLARHYYGPRGLGSHPSTQGGVADSAGAVDALAPTPENTYDPSRLAAWAEFHRAVEGLGDSDRGLFDLLWYQ